MVDASNILRFEGVGGTADDVEYAMELWLFKPQKTGQQVNIFLRAEVKIPFVYLFGPSGGRVLPLGVAAERSVHYFGDFFCATYFSPRRGCLRVMKFCVEF